MIPAILLLASLASAQSTTTVRDLDLDRKLVNMSVDIRDFQSGSPTLTGTPTYQGGFRATGAATFSAPVTFSSATFNGWVSISSNVIGSLRRSSETINTGTANYANTSFDVCQSTLSIYTQGQPVELSLDVMTFSGSGNARLCAVVLQDGQFIANHNPTWCAYSDASVSSVNLGSVRTIPAPAPGKHTYCVGYYTNAGTGQWDQQATPEFRVRELP